MKWAIIYKDKVIRGEGLEEWNKAPTDGIQFVIAGNQILSDNEYYLYHQGLIYGTNDISGTLRQLGFIKFGSTITSAEFEGARKLVSRTIMDIT